MTFKNGMLGFIVGGLTGAAVAFLYAPQSGEETRQILLDNSEKVKENALESIQEAQDMALEKLSVAQVRAEKTAQEARRIFNQLQDIGQATLKKEKEILEKGLDQAKTAVNS